MPEPDEELLPLNVSVLTVGAVSWSPVRACDLAPGRGFLPFRVCRLPEIVVRKPWLGSPGEILTVRSSAILYCAILFARGFRRVCFGRIRVVAFVKGI